ncbi:MAG: hypothetical protein IAE89_08230 [Anaerolineae bacterium]|nr:hypothetical protein [Anaerolineae bacterium]
MSAMRQDEVFAKAVFNCFLEKITVDPIIWKDGNQNEPPDFYLSFGSNEFVVEVTALMQHVKVQEQNVPILALSESLKRFVGKIEREAIEAEILNGTYYVIFNNWYGDFQGVSKKLSQDIFDFIQGTQSATQSHPISIEIDFVNYCRIQKIAKPDNHVHIGIYPRTAMVMEAARRETRELLESMIVNKSKKLGEFTQPKILLLIAQSYFVDSEVYSELAKGLDLSGFHTVFLIDGYDLKRSYVLHSQNNDWLSATNF